MRKLTCEMCGGTDLLKEDGVFACQSCGTKYSVEEAKKMMVEGTVQVAGTVGIDKTQDIENLMVMAREARVAGNAQRTEGYAARVLEADPRSWEAWLIKAWAVGWQSTLANERVLESLSMWSNVAKYVDEENSDAAFEAIMGDAAVLLLTLIKARATHFAEYPSEDEAQALIESVDNAQALLLRLSSDVTGRVTDALLIPTVSEQAGLQLVKAAVTVFTDSVKEMNPRSSDYAFERFNEAMYAALRVAEAGAPLLASEEDKRWAYDFLIQRHEELVDLLKYKDYGRFTEEQRARAPQIWKYKEEIQQSYVREADQARETYFEDRPEIRSQVDELQRLVEAEGSFAGRLAELRDIYTGIKADENSILKNEKKRLGKKKAEAEVQRARANVEQAKSRIRAIEDSMADELQAAGIERSRLGLHQQELDRLLESVDEACR